MFILYTIWPVLCQGVKLTFFITFDLTNHTSSSKLIPKYMRRYITLIIILSLSFLLPFLNSSSLFGQQISDQATREEDRDIRGEIEEKMITPPKKLPEIKEEIEEKPKEEGPRFFIKKIKLEGVETLPEEDFMLLLEKYENRDVAFSELEILAKEIERHYLRKGIIAACFVPPQDIEEGVVKLRVVEAKMGNLRIKEHKYFSESRLRYHWLVEPGEVLRYDKLSHSLQLMNKNPDRFVKATLHAGKKPETTDVLLEADTNFPIHATLSYDREGSPSTGRYRKGAGFVANNLFGFDDILMHGYNWGDDYTSIYFYHRLPITRRGTSLLYGYNWTQSFPKKGYRQFEISSRTESYSAFLHQDLFMKGEYKGEFNIGLEAKDKGSCYNKGTLNRDKLRILRTGGLLIFKGLKSVMYLRPELSQGLNIFGAVRRNEYSSRNAENTFTKVNLDASYKKALFRGLQASAKFKGQLASQALVPMEELYLGGINSIRGYPSGDFLADNGFHTNIELLVSPFFLPDELRFPYGAKPLKDEVTGVVFFDYGYGERVNALSTETSKRTLASVGVGVRVRVFDQALLRLEWGWPLMYGGFANRPENEFANSRFHFSLDFQDRVFEEFGRIQKEIGEDNIKCEAWGLLNAEMKNPESPLRIKLHRYLYLARQAEEEWNFRDAKTCYARVSVIIKSAYRQAENYVRETVKQREELVGHNRLATQYYRNREYEKARELLEKVKAEAKVKPFLLQII